jgi:hypothetical protein
LNFSGGVYPEERRAPFNKTILLNINCAITNKIYINNMDADNEVDAYRKFLNPPSGDRGYFNFEEDFIEENVRCIPMIVRFKMDAAGIKLKLAEWSKFRVDERIALAIKAAATKEEAAAYNHYLSALIKKYTNADATTLTVEAQPAWSVLHSIPQMLQEKAKECGWEISITQWQQLTNLHRFALLKLCRPGHENKNFPTAMKEFGLIT